MLNPQDDRTTNAQVDDVLLALRTNLAEHKEILIEAKKGYITKCREAFIKARTNLTKRIKDIDKGLQPDQTYIVFPSEPPADHSKDFETVIKMLELHKAAHEGAPANRGIPATIQLRSADVKKYVLNDWDWADAFFKGTVAYSAKSQIIAKAKGIF